MDVTKQYQPPTDGRLLAVCRQFEANAAAVQRLMTFDRDIVEFARAKVQTVHDEFEKNSYRLDRLETLLRNALTALTNIRENQSLRREYSNIHNQGIVLLVSYFSSAVKEVFTRCVNERLRRLPAEQLPIDAFSIKLSQIRTLKEDNLADLVIEKEKLSFQDMGSIARGLSTWLLYEPARDDDVRTIIAAQACRHAIVHTGAVADEKLIRILNANKPRKIALDLSVGDEIGLSLQDLDVISASMRGYLVRTANGAWGKLPVDPVRTV